MAKKKRVIHKGKYPMPKFKSLEEESEFWDTHSPLDYGEWEEVTLKEVMKDVQRRSQKKVPISIRVELELVEKLKKVAKEHGVPYQRVAREILWRGLSKVA
jgi:predicted DNA binding CopG/RHH family protein